MRRQRVRDEEEVAWVSFLKEKEQSESNYDQPCAGSKHKSLRTLAESIEDVDRELMRLEADALPETRGRYDGHSARDSQV